MTKLPQRFEERMKQLLGEEYEAFRASYEKERVQGLRFNELKAGDEFEGLAARLEKEMEGLSLSPVPWVKEGYYYTGTARPGKHPYHEAGLYYIQEPSAMAVVELLDPKPGDAVLDLCAAPGGKSSHIASRLGGQGFLLSNEIHPARARILSQNMERMGVFNVVVSNEDSSVLAQHFPEFFDRIAVDAPCSGEGMFRKDEEAVNQWSEEHVHQCAARQQEILDNGARMLKPGGRLVYSTCTFAPEENEQAISRFLLRHSEFSLEQVPHYEGFSEGRPQWAGEEGTGFPLERAIRIMPHKLEGEGHFIAVLKKSEGLSQASSCKMPVYLDKKKERLIWSSAESFLKENLENGEELAARREYVMFGEQLYLFPPQMTDMKGLKIVRPGLHIGTVKKNRLEPSHALALSLLPGQAKRVCRLSPDSPEAVRYLKGEALPCEGLDITGGDKGWILICVGDVSLGWGKGSGGIIKNHYPKGLRWV